MTVSSWADKYRVLSPEAAASPGRWKTSNNEPMREIMDTIGARDVESIVVMSSAQIGKSEGILNMLGFYMVQDPAPILLVQPTLDMAKAFSKDRIAPMLRDTPVLERLIGDAKSRTSGNTVLHKLFPGGHITLAGANSPASLASRPIRIVLCDEVDKYPASAGTEGDPVNLARKRTKTFWNKKIVLTSTPGVKHLSRIESEWELSDQRRFHVPCPHCGEKQILKWAHVKWPSGKPEDADYECEYCGVFWSDHERWEAINSGEGIWIPEADFRGIAGFHLNEIYSSWVKLSEMAQDFLDAKGNPQKLKTFVNSSLGESFEETAEKVDAHLLSNRLEPWGDILLPELKREVPKAVLVITCGVDVQDDRIEIERTGWGVEEESWSLDHTIIYGDPSTGDIWKELDEYLLTTSIREDGRELPVHAACVDTAGHHTNAAYAFCKPRFRRRIYAIIGRSGAGKPVWPKRATTNNKGHVYLFTVGTDAAKDSIYARLRLDHAGPGFCHFPTGRENAYFDQITSEIVKTEYQKGFPHRVYILPPHRRNEGLDLRVYSYAALQALNVRWGIVQQLDDREIHPKKPIRVPTRVTKEEPAAQQMFSEPRGERPAPPQPSRFGNTRRSNWMGQ